MTLTSYFKYLTYNKLYFLLPVALLFFILTEAANTAFFRILGYFDLNKLGQGLALPFNYYWLALGLVQVGYFLFMAIKYYLINYLALKSNEKLHDDMLFGMLRSPSSYFDKTPTGRLINRFSNDLSILDSSLSAVLIDTFEGPILILVLFINVFQIVPWFAIAGVINIAALIYWFFYCKKVIVQSKQLDLRTKSPVFS